MKWIEMVEQTEQIQTEAPSQVENSSGKRSQKTMSLDHSLMYWYFLAMYWGFFMWGDIRFVTTPSAVCGIFYYNFTVSFYCISRLGWPSQKSKEAQATPSFQWGCQPPGGAWRYPWMTTDLQNSFPLGKVAVLEGGLNGHLATEVPLSPNSTIPSL